MINPTFAAKYYGNLPHQEPIRHGYAIAERYDLYWLGLGPYWQNYKYLPTGEVRGLGNTVLLCMGRTWRNKAVDDNWARIIEYCHDRHIVRINLADLWEQNRQAFNPDGTITAAVMQKGIL
jgi:hypothetical protein